MNPLAQQLIYALVRHLLTGVSAYLIGQGLLSQQQSDDAIFGIAGFVAMLAWSAVQKWHASRAVTVALTLPANSSLARLKEAIKARF